MKENYLDIDGKAMFYRHNPIEPERLSLLLVHGLGDSGISFEDAFRYDFLDKYNIIIPDLIGYGRSSGAVNIDDYGYETQVEYLWRLINKLNLQRVIAAGHSMGGDITTMLCNSDTAGVIRKYISIEGDVTQYDLTISRATVKALDRFDFERWYEHDFKQKLVWGKLGALRSGRLYYASLAFCRVEAFVANARELVRRNSSLEGKFKSEIGEMFLNLDLPKVFCYGTKSLARSSLRFLTENNIPLRAFEGAGHSPMSDYPDEFYKFVREYIDK